MLIFEINNSDFEPETNLTKKQTGGGTIDGGHEMRGVVF
jgi:hypothetical protein